MEAAESPGDQRRTAGDERHGDQYARREAVDDDQGARLAFELPGVEQHEHAADEEAEHADLDTERCRALSGDQQQDARQQRDDEEDESLTGMAAVRLGRGEPRGVDRDGDEEQAGERRRAADDGDPVVAPRLDVERHRWGRSLTLLRGPPLAGPRALAPTDESGEATSTRERTRHDQL